MLHCNDKIRVIIIITKTHRAMASSFENVEDILQFFHFSCATSLPISREGFLVKHSPIVATFRFKKIGLG